MSFLLDEGQQAIATESRRIVDARFDQSAALRLLEDHGAYDEAWWAMAREQGWPAIAVPEADGGLGLGLIELGQVGAGDWQRWRRRAVSDQRIWCRRCHCPSW